MKNFIDSLDEWLYNEMGLMGGCCSSIDSLKYTTARTAVEKLLKEIQKEKEIKSFEDCTFYMTSPDFHTKPKCIPDGLYIIHERLGLSLGSDWNPENNEGVIGILSVVGDETLVISLETKQQTITPNIDFSQYQTDAKKRLMTVREFEKFFYDIEKLNELLKKTGGVPISGANFYLVDETETELKNRFYNMNTGVIAPLSGLSVGSLVCIKTVQDFVPFN